MICGKKETDEHLFQCPGYIDLIGTNDINYKMFFKLDCSMDMLDKAAGILSEMVKRLETIKNL